MLDFLTSCKHTFKVVEVLPFKYNTLNDGQEDIPVKLLECSSCGFRKVERAQSFLYPASFLEKLEKWIKKEIEVDEI